MNTNNIIILIIFSILLSGCLDSRSTTNTSEITVSETMISEHTPEPTPYVSNIDERWVRDFIDIVNSERFTEYTKLSNKMWSSMALNAIARERFNKMSKRPYTSHFEADMDMYNTGEEILFPDGFTPKEYVSQLKTKAPIHWNGLIDPKIKNYGFYFEEGNTLSIIQPCSITEITDINVDEKEYLKSFGCETVETRATWLVIELS